MTILAVALGGALGSVCRYLVGLMVEQWAGHTFPLGTLLINITGSLLLGFILRYSMLSTSITLVPRLMLTTGFCGGYTTFSAFSYETALLIEDGSYLRAGFYVGLSVIVSLFGVFLGFQLARSVVSFSPR